MDNREACIILNLIGGVGSKRFLSLLEYFKEPKEIFNPQNRGKLKQFNFPETIIEKIINWESIVSLEDELKLVDISGTRIITILDEDYPKDLKTATSPPYVLYVRGKLPDFEKSISIVGSRRTTNYGRKMGQHFAESFSFANWVVVSGLAYGIDAIAHKAVVDTDGITVAVLGGGLARLHPQDHAKLARQIIEKGGAIISEFPMNFPPCKHSFPMRNRIVAWLTKGTLVIEAGLKSGSMITTNFALEEGRFVFAVPGQADAPQSRGCNDLIKKGAKLVENIEDIFEEFEFLPGFGQSDDLFANNMLDTEKKQENFLTLSEDEAIIVSFLKENKIMTVDELAVKTGFKSSELLSKLLILELKHQVKELPGKQFCLY
jgi:DNA processing protein